MGDLARLRHITPTVVALAALGSWENPDYLLVALLLTVAWAIGAATVAGVRLVLRVGARR